MATKTTKTTKATKTTTTKKACGCKAAASNKVSVKISVTSCANELYILGNTKNLSAWNADKAVKLTKKGNKFSKSLSFDANSNLEYIGENAFSTTLTNIGELPSSLLYIGENAFLNSRITSISFGENSKITQLIGCFQGTKITSVVIPKSVNYLSSAFRNCSDLTSLTFEETGTWYGVTYEGNIIELDVSDSAINLQNRNYPIWYK